MGNSNSEMPEAAAPSSAAPQDSKKEEAPAEPQLDLGGNAALIEESVRTKEPRSTVRALRNLVAIRARLTAEFLAEAVQRTFESTSSFHDTLLSALDQSMGMQTDDDAP